MSAEKTSEGFYFAISKIARSIPKTRRRYFRNSAVDFVAKHVGQGEIRITDRQFRGFVVVAANGVATGWAAEKSI